MTRDEAIARIQKAIDDAVAPPMPATVAIEVLEEIAGSVDAQIDALRNDARES